MKKALKFSSAGRMGQSTILGFFLALVLGSMMASSCEKKNDSFEGEIEYDVNVVNDPEGKYKTILPEKYILTMRNNQVRFGVQGGIISSLFGGMMFDGKNKRAYLLMKSSKLAYKLPQEEPNALDREAGKIKSKVTSYPDSVKIKGYWCQKFFIESEEDGEMLKNELWIASKIKAKYPSNLTKYLPALFHSSINGMPLRVITYSNTGREIHMEASNIDPRSIDDDSFEVPEGYTETDDDPSPMIVMMKKMMR